jgi:type I restriction-modification system DNA methylase subunit
MAQETNNAFQLSLSINPPHNNQYLFSDHYLNNLLPQEPIWQNARRETQAFLEWLQDHYARERNQLASYKESQLEDHWFAPILRRLGHVFEGQASVPGLGRGIKYPDYVLFPNEAARRTAASAQKTEQYVAKALAVGEVKAWDVPLGKKLKGGGPSFDDQNPSQQLNYYLQTTGLTWGILSNGRLWRLVHKDSSQRLTIYYEVDLVSLLQQANVETLRYFTLFFRQAAFQPNAQGRIFLNDALAASHAYAVALEEDLQQNVYQALEKLIQGFLDLPQNRLGAADLRHIYDNSLYLLYRLLFILYAESRGLLPLQNEAYREHYSLMDIKQDIAQRNAPTAPRTTIFWSRLQTLFHIINGDDAELNRHLGVPRYNGGLFSRQLHPFLEEKAVGDQALVAAIDLLSRRQTPAGLEFADYRTLGVRQLGSIYEGLLEYQPRYAAEPMVAIRQGKGEKWLPAGQATRTATVTAERAVGQVYLETDRGERKATGSYYTPQYIVDYIVANTLGPLVAQATERVRARGQAARSRADKAAAAQSLVDEILNLKILDPAMGSGHFPVAATEYLALALATDPYVETEATPEEDVTYWKRRVVERCIYGVDKNPLAVELAKLSLWLATVAVDRPLSFLDHHLKGGDSLIGARVSDLGWPPPVVLGKKGQKQVEQQKAGQMNLFEYRLSQQLPVVMGKILEITGQESDSYETVQAKEAADEAVRQLKAPFAAVANLWVSAYFGSSFTPAEYGEALETIGKPAELLTMTAVQQAQQMVQERRFFHWELAFPEVFYNKHGQSLSDKIGFDAIIGNPPYISAWSMTDTNPTLRNAINQLVKPKEALSGHWDLYVAFLLKSHELCKVNGRLSFIIPNPFSREKYATTTRKFLLENTHIERVVSFGEENVFDEVSRQTLIPVFRKEVPDLALVEIQVESPLRLLGLALENGYKIPQNFFYQLPEYQLRFEGTAAHLTILSKIDEVSCRLGEVCYVNYGAQVSSKEKGKFGKVDVVLDSPRGNAKRFFDGKNLSRYEISWDGRYLDYRPNEMYGPRAPELFEAPKIVIRDVTGANERLIVSFDNAELYCDHLVICATYYRYIQDTALQDEFEGFEQVPEPHPDLLYMTGLLASELNTWYFREVFATGTLQGTYSHTYPQQIRAFPIYRVIFTTSAEERKRLLEKAERLYGRYCEKEDLACVLGFVVHHLGQEQADVVHDLLAFLAGQMIAMNKEKQQITADFWLDLEGAADAATFAALQKGKQEASLWAAEAIRPFASRDSRSTHTLEESLSWREDAFKAFVRLLASNVPSLSSLVHIYRRHSPAYSDLARRLAATDRLIDQIVYQLYGLTEGEIAIVEGKQ